MAIKNTENYSEKSRISRPGVHSKTKHSSHKSGKHYKKAYRGQGK